MTDLFSKKEGLTDEEALFKMCLIYSGMKQKTKEEGKYKTEENK